MIDHAKVYKSPPPIAKNVQFKLESLPRCTVPLDSLKTLENQLSARGLLISSQFYPLWFHAETERNVFLWRKGCSLIQADEFDFWIDARRLVDKRLRQLESPSVNPLSTPLWESGSIQNSDVQAERQYLEDFRTWLVRGEKHLHAMSIAGRMVANEIHHSAKEIVLLPAMLTKQA
jgi:hypothetical protein